MPISPLSIAYFISSHGFGHAARSTAIMLSLMQRIPELHFHIFTEVPSQFFNNKGLNYTYHRTRNDVGFVQTSPLQHDIAQTLAALEQFLHDLDKTTRHTATALLHQHCQLALCDIAPLGIMAAQKAGIPAVLLENFTWDWLYQPYAAEYPALNEHIEFLRKVFRQCDYLIQTEPACEKRQADLTTYPVSRTPQQSRSTTRKQLAFPEHHKLITITMGGIRSELKSFERLDKMSDCTFVLPGTGEHISHLGNSITLPLHSEIYHPDLMHASDLVIGKLGYSTLAEVYYAGVPFVYVMREDFRESGCLANFVDTHMIGLPVPASSFEEGYWIDQLPRLLTQQRQTHDHINGAEQVAEFIVSLLSRN